MEQERADGSVEADELTLERVARVLEAAEDVLITMHAWPDGDALGSALGLALALEDAGKRVTVYNPQPAPSALAFIPGSERVRQALDPQARYDATVACDAGHPSRLGPALPERERRGVLVNLDHHLSTPRFGDLNLIDVGAAAVGVIIHRILRRMGLRPSAEVATALLVSLVTDTGSFRYSNTNPEALRVAAELVACGARPWGVASALYETQAPERIRLLGLVLPTLELRESGRVACLTVTERACHEAGTSEETAEGFVSHARSIAGVEVAILFREAEPAWRISLRSRGRIDVAAIARALGGGGHHNAAGCSIAGSAEEVRSIIFAATSAALEG